jgi:hypothetical protein
MFKMAPTKQQEPKEKFLKKVQSFSDTLYLGPRWRKGHYMEMTAYAQFEESTSPGITGWPNQGA